MIYTWIPYFLLLCISIGSLKLNLYFTCIFQYLDVTNLKNYVVFYVLKKNSMLLKEISILTNYANKSIHVAII